MQQEIEVKFLNVDHNDVRAKLQTAGAKLEQPMRLMRRIHFDYPDKRFQKGALGQRLRVRDEGDKFTVTYKSSNETKYRHEIETTVGSFDEMISIFEAIGLEEYSYQESRREAWYLDNVEIVLDEWPWLNTYIEIEGPDEESIMAVAKKLGFDWKDSKFGSVDTAYMDQYKGMNIHESIGDFPEVKFDMPVPKFFTDRLKV